MRSMKRPRKPVHRYRSLLFPGVAVLAVFLFWAAFEPREQPGGETALFERGGLKIEITGVREVGEDFPNGGGPEPCPVYTVFPGAVATVLEAGVGADGGPLWAFETAGEDGRLDIVDGMAPLEITPEVTGVLDPETGVYALRFVLREPEE